MDYKGTGFEAADDEEPDPRTDEAKVSWGLKAAIAAAAQGLSGAIMTFVRREIVTRGRELRSVTL